MNTLDVYIYDLVNSQVVGKEAIANRQGLRFTREYPGGLGGVECSFFVPRDVKAPWDIDFHHRMTVFNGFNLIWEGEITKITPEISGSFEGDRITAEGYWATLFQKRRWQKWWCDTRLTDGVWQWDETLGGAEMGFVDREDRIRLTPKAEATTDGTGFGVRYLAPTGTTIDRIEYTYDMKEAAQAWELQIYDNTNTSAELSITADASLTDSLNFSPVTSDFSFRFLSRASQTPPSDGTIYGEFSAFRVYATYETGHSLAEGTFNISALGQDVIELLSNTAANYFSADKDGIDTSLTYALEPFISEHDSLARILERAAAFGDGSNGRVAAAVELSDKATDAHPKLLVENTAALTDYDYQIDFDSPQLDGRVTLKYTTRELANYVIVQYTDEQGFRQVVTPGDDASLTDSTSVTKYGQRDYVLRLGQVTQAQAIHLGETHLTRYKNPRWVMRPVRVRSYIERKNGTRVPASEITPGKRIKVSSFLDDGSGTWHIYLITGVRYDEDSQICTITTDDDRIRDPELERLRAGLEL